MSGKMSAREYQERLSALKCVIEGEVFVRKEVQRSTDDVGNGLSWIMDFRRVVLRGDILSQISELLIENLHENGNTNFQVGGLESAAIPIVVGIVMKSREWGHVVNGFFIRKSRKKSGLMQIVEGVIGDEPIVLVDDILNTGNSIMKQVDILESLGKKVARVCVILQFRNTDEYTELLSRGIEIHSLFTLNDLSAELGVKNIVSVVRGPVLTPLSMRWGFSSPGATYEHVMPKSAPLLYEGKLYFGSDNGTFWCIDAKDASIVWQRKILHGSQNKRIFSSPVIMHGIVYFGGYDGNFYALDAKTGKPKWVAFDADWIGSSPCVAEDLRLVFVGMEFGFWKEKGGVAAYRADTGELAWRSGNSEYTHSSPAYTEKYHIVVCGSNDGVVRGYSAKDGALLWAHDTGGAVKAGCALSPDEQYVAVGSFNMQFVILETKTGKMVSTLQTLEGNYSTPAWLNGDVVICASLDKSIYAYNVPLGKVLWKHETDARIFAGPRIVDERLYIGNNAGIVYILNAITGESISEHHVIERVTNAIIVDTEESVMYIPTHANQIIKADLPLAS